MTSQMKKSKTQYHRLNTIFESIIDSSEKENIDEGILNFLSGGRGGMTPQQTREYNLFTQNFTGNLNGQMNRAIQSRQVNKDNANSIKEYLNVTFFPSYLRNNWPLTGQVKSSYDAIVSELATNWNTSKKNKSLSDMSALIYNVLAQRGKSSTPDSGGTPSGASTPATTGTGSFFNQLQASIDGGWNNLTRQQKRTLKSLIAGKPD